MLDKTKRDWWKQAVVYQIYPKSFQDTNGDGIGDLEGIRLHLDYLETLGVDAIWLCPILASPQVDNGYDVSDYCAIDPMFGTMEQMRQLIQEAKARGISILMDMVLNHSSDQHKWFQEARKGRDNPFHDYYIWRDGAPDTPPNDLKAAFGGSAWTWDSGIGQYYFHQFAPEQPDLNWQNPKVRQEIYHIFQWWVDQGVDGFRLDVMDGIAKDPDQGITGNGPRLQEFLQEMSAEVFQKSPLLTVGEAWGADVEKAKQFSALDGRALSMVFQFEPMTLERKPGGKKWDLVPLSVVELKRSYARWQQELHGCAWNSLFLDNHDLPRIVSRWGDEGSYRVRSAKMLATMLYGMEGTPFLYQGEEIGMTNIRLPIEKYQDLAIHNDYREMRAAGVSEEQAMEFIYARGRDNARTPMQWDDSPSAGFTTGTPWLPVHPNHTEIHVKAALADSDSIFYHYQKLIAMRKEYSIFTEGTFTLLAEEDPHVFAYLRQVETEEVLVVCHFGAETSHFPMLQEWYGAKELISNVSAPMGLDLRPWEARILWRKR